jgi:hypothetical protein
VAGSSKHGNENSGSINGVEFLDQLSDYQLCCNKDFTSRSKKDSHMFIVTY